MMKQENDSSRDSSFDDDNRRPTAGKETGSIPQGDPTCHPTSNSVGNQQQLLDCPICERKFLKDETPAMPFCSRRCQQVDMGRWLTESYVFPSETEDVPIDDDEFESEL